MRKEDRTGTCIYCGETLGEETYPSDMCRECLKKYNYPLYKYFIEIEQIKENKHEVR